MSSELLTKVGSGVEAVGCRRNACGVLCGCARLCRCVWARVGPDRLLAYCQGQQRWASKSFWDSHHRCGEVVCEFKAVVGLYALGPHAPRRFEPFDRDAPKATVSVRGTRACRCTARLPRNPNRLPVPGKTPHTQNLKRTQLRSLWESILEPARNTKLWCRLPYAALDCHAAKRYNAVNAEQRTPLPDVNSPTRVWYNYPGAGHVKEQFDVKD